MKIIEVISKMKAYHGGIGFNGKPIDESTTRDKILYGNPEQECTGIVTTCWASMDVIRKAHAAGANLIICHEALFYYRGDHTEWLEESENKTFAAKKALLDETGIVVWRDHDYIHSGIPMYNQYVDGIFFGLMKELDWENYLSCEVKRPMIFEFPETNAKQLGQELINKLKLNGIKVIGNLNTPIKKVMISSHIMGEIDKEVIKKVDKENIDCLISLEIIDYTVSEYIRDSGMCGTPKVVLAVGHFNVEEPGMKYMLNYLDAALGEHIPAQFIQSGDMYNFITK